MSNLKTACAQWLEKTHCCVLAVVCTALDCEGGIQEQCPLTLYHAMMQVQEALADRVHDAYHLPHIMVCMLLSMTAKHLQCALLCVPILDSG